ncbi:hypothetical protein BDY19DRAFT_991434 [Irpex rosettiformis]|uniref:Uncharacterized protein n=1 Tax=Irpex rosettiformis TaxID=378272 RepID=A0ACB8UBZ6_9APHY|nr:hypothetical protein BDY19DRAFT_991434 [Irpex rosettiformis]
MSAPNNDESHPSAHAEPSSAMPLMLDFSNSISLDFPMQILGWQAFECFRTQGDMLALEMAIRSWRFQEVASLTNLAMALHVRFQSVGECCNFEEANGLWRLANVLILDDWPEKPSRLSNLATLIISQFEQSGRFEDLEEAIDLWTCAAKLASDDHENKPGLLNNLGSALCTQFQQFGNISDLEKAITLQSCVVDLRPDGHPGKPRWLVNLAISLER